MAARRWIARSIALGCALVVLAGLEVQAQRAFPGAEGAGAYAAGGRGGDVYWVTNLNDAGEGSLRHGIETKNSDQPRTILFAVAGIIELKSDLQIRTGNLTIAGQSAPGGGITLAGRQTVVSGTRDIIIQHLRFRPGDRHAGAGYEPDALWVRSSHDVMIDHVTASWGVDENLSVTHGSFNVTVQWSLINQALYHAGHEKQANHGYGSLINGGDITFHHNLYADNRSRNPRPQQSHVEGLRTRLDFVNNVIHNPGDRYGYSHDDRMDLNLVGVANQLWDERDINVAKDPRLAADGKSSGHDLLDEDTLLLGSFSIREAQEGDAIVFDHPNLAVFLNLLMDRDPEAMPADVVTLLLECVTAGAHASGFASSEDTSLLSEPSNGYEAGALAPTLQLTASPSREAEASAEAPWRRGKRLLLEPNRPELDLPIADERLVMAHYMTGMLPTPEAETDRWMNPAHYDPHGPTARIGGHDQTLPVPMLLFPDLLPMQDAALLEMTTARVMGVDGFNFYYPFGPDSAFRDRYDRFILAFFHAAEAHDLDFKLTLCFAPHGGLEMSTAEKIEVWGTRLRSLMTRTEHSDHWLRTPDGRYLFYTWIADGMVSAELNGRHWEIREHSELLRHAASAFDQIAQRAGLDGAFLYHLQFPADRQFLSRVLDYFPAVTGWVNVGNELGRWRHIAAECRERNRAYVQEVHPDYYTSKIYRRGGDDLIFQTDRVLDLERHQLERHGQVLGLTQTFRDKLQMAIDLDVPLINLTTWNDYPEGHHLAPEINHNFGFSLLLRHFRATWRSEPEEGPRDVTMVFFKKYPAEVTPDPFDIAVRNKKSADAPAVDDGIEVITILDHPSQLHVNEHIPRPVPAGLAVTHYPMRPGPVEVEVKRRDESVVRFTTPEWITFEPYRTDRLTYSFSSEFERIYRRIYGVDAPLHTSMEYAENEEGEPQWRRANE